MPYDQQFGLFEDGEEGPLWRAFFSDVEDAKARAQIFADDEGRVFFVYNLKDSTVIKRVFPSRA